MTLLSECVEVYTHCEQCGYDDSFTSDHKGVVTGEDWEQTCTNYPDCTADRQIVTRVISYE